MTQSAPAASHAYAKRVVCFLDILGFRDIVAKTIDGHGVIQSARVAAITKALRRLSDIQPSPDNYFLSRRITQFSDSIVISFDIAEPACVFFTLLDILHLQIDLVVGGVLCRGGVAVGHMHHSSEHLFGPAMIAAYDLESKIARFPRVIVAPEVIECGAGAPAHHNRATHELQHIQDLLAIDEDEWPYINYVSGAQSELDDPEDSFPTYLGHVASVLREGYAHAPASARCKFDWLRGHYLECVMRGTTWSAQHRTDLHGAYTALPTTF